MAKLTDARCSRSRIVQGPGESACYRARPVGEGPVLCRHRRCGGRTQDRGRWHPVAWLDFRFLINDLGCRSPRTAEETHRGRQRSRTSSTRIRHGRSSPHCPSTPGADRGRCVPWLGVAGCSTPTCCPSVRPRRRSTPFDAYLCQCAVLLSPLEAPRFDVAGRQLMASAWIRTQRFSGRPERRHRPRRAGDGLRASSSPT